MSFHLLQRDPMNGRDRLKQTSPQQARFEEDQERMGDADVVGEDWREDDPEDEDEG